MDTGTTEREKRESQRFTGSFADSPHWQSLFFNAKKGERHSRSPFHIIMVGSLDNDPPETPENHSKVRSGRGNARIQITLHSAADHIVTHSPGHRLCRIGGDASGIRIIAQAGLSTIGTREMAEGVLQVFKIL